MTRPEVASILGDPDRIDEDEIENERSIAWHYEGLGFSVYFDEDADFRLDLFDIEHPEAEIDQVRPIGLSENETLSALAHLGEITLDDEFSESGRRIYDIEECSISLYFEDGICDSVQVAVMVDSNDEYSWPAQSNEESHA